MSELKVGVVDVFVVDPRPEGWKILVLRRAAGTRCTGAWEVVHGRIEEGERAADAAAREVAEEAGVRLQRLYSITCHPFYLHHTDTVQVAVVFAAFADSDEEVILGDEHDVAEWVTVEQAQERLVWPRSRASLTDIVALLGGGDAGPVEDVLRVW